MKNRKRFVIVASILILSALACQLGEKTALKPACISNSSPVNVSVPNSTQRYCGWPSPNTTTIPARFEFPWAKAAAPVVPRKAINIIRSVPARAIVLRSVFVLPFTSSRLTFYVF